jgi:hypothetical protein
MATHSLAKVTITRCFGLGVSTCPFLLREYLLGAVLVVVELLMFGVSVMLDIVVD